MISGEKGWMSKGRERMIGRIGRCIGIDGRGLHGSAVDDTVFSSFWMAFCVGDGERAVWVSGSVAVFNYNTVRQSNTHAQSVINHRSSAIPDLH